MRFASLHGHSSFSYGDGHKLPEHHVLRAKELGIKAIALTEHGNVSSHVQLEKAADKHGIKAIYGVEAYVAEPEEKQKYHQTILAMDEEGYRQLNRLVTRSYSEGFYGKPTVHPEWLLDPDLTSHLILLSGCADSWLSCTLAGGKGSGERLVDTEEPDETLNEELEVRYNKAVKLAEKFRDVYRDRYYLEVQPFDNYPRTCYLNQKIVEISHTLSIPIVATADVHYPHPEDWEVQRLSNAIAWGETVEGLAKKRDYEAGLCTYPEDDKSFAQRLMRTGLNAKTAAKAIRNSEKVAERCNVRLPKTTPVRFSGSDGTEEGARKILKQKIKEGIKYRQETSQAFSQHFSEHRADYVARLKKELDVILTKEGFADYFLVNWQVIGWAKDQGIAVGPGRGSAASSLVCYLLRLTEVNPMEFPEMVFERFLDPSREDEPDIDTDYPDDRRNEVFEFARREYGEENVGNIGNFARFRGKTAVKTAGKALAIPIKDTEDFAELIGTPPYGDPREFDSAEDAARSFPEAEAVEKRNPDLKVAYRLEGDMRTLGIHAAGMVLSNSPISETCALYKRSKTNGEEAEVIAYDKRDASYLQMLKLDCLGLKTMTIINDVIEMVDELSLEQLYELPRDDEKTLKAFGEDDLTGIFQFEGRSTRGIVKDIFLGKDKVPTFMQLADINALSRPGSLSSGMTRQYINVENGKSRKTIHPVVDKILESTNGCLVYQEQVMRIGKEFGGLDDSEVGRLRKIIGAKQAGGAFEAFWEKFKNGAMSNHGASEAKAREVWEYMAASASYLFNVSHAISYALVAYWTQYLKQHYPAEFFAASLRSAATKGKIKGKAEPQLLILQDAVAHGLTVNPPSYANSGLTWSPNAERTGVEAGFIQLPKVGKKTALKMIEMRETAHPADLSWEFFSEGKIGFGVKSVQAAKAMQESADPFEIHLTNNALVSVVEAIRDGEVPLAMPNSSSATLAGQEGERVTYLGHVVAVKIIDHLAEVRQRENLTHEEVCDRIEKPELGTKAKIICADKGGTEVHVNISRYIYPQLADEIHEIDTKKAPFVLWAEGKASSAFGPSVQADQIVAIEMEK